MSIEFQRSELAPQIAGLLQRFRLRIRSYVWTDGLAAVVIVLGLGFWTSLAFDWLFEPPWQFRAVILLGLVAAVAYVVNRLIVHRAFRQLDDADLAVVLERRFRDYRDSLLTTVELSEHAHHTAGFNTEMLNHTRQEAAWRSEAVRLGDAFRMSSLLRTLAVAAVLAISVLAFACVAQTAFVTWAERVLLLDKTLLWPRANHVRVQDFPANHLRKVAKGSDFEVIAVAELAGEFKLPEYVQLRYRTEEGTHGRDNMSTMGTSGAHDREQKYSYAFKGVMSSIDFDLFGGDDRDRGFRVEVVDNPTISHMELACEYPEYTGRPANTVPASALVQLPQGTKLTIHCEANKDLVEVPVTVVRGDKATALADVQLPTEGDRRHFSVSLPELMEDTALLFELQDADGIRSRDPVRLVLATRADDVPVVALRLRGVSTAITPQARLPLVGEAHDDYGLTRLWFEYQLEKGNLHGKSANSLSAFGNGSSNPLRGAASMAETSSGGTPAAGAAQPAEQPLKTSILEHNGRPRSQINIELTDGESLDLKRLSERYELLLRRGVKTLADLARINVPDEQVLVAELKTQQQLDQALAFAPQVGDRLIVALKAADNCALPSGANVGQGERYQLDIVPPEQLLSMLEGRELMLRRQFEIIYQELTDTRDALARLDFGNPSKKPVANPAAHEPGDSATREPGDQPANKSAGSDAGGAEPGPPNETPQQRAERLAQRVLELRDLRVARALDNGDRSAHETLTVADAFDDIREEMGNNRVDTPELQTRLKDQIADPLRHVGTRMFPELRTRLVQLRRMLDDTQAGPGQLQAAVTQCDAILAQMKLVLDKMLELETFNQVVDMLRDIIAEQDKLNKETFQRQKDELKNKLRDLQNP
ncbi:MAG TPA: hypothetical protein VFE46_19895 [Pirellulales bacterium]|jgi:hypothetical protein|nr:hypothetical protein [Pirellulales bacterium]